MKKLLSVLLAACMLLTMLSLPAIAAETEEAATYVYHKFDFSEGKDQYTYGNVRVSLDGEPDMRSFAPISLGNQSNGGHGGAANYDGKGNAVVDYVPYGDGYAMRIRTNSTDSHRQSVINPIYKNGDGKWTAMKAAPGGSYKLSYSIVVVRAYDSGHTRSQIEPWTNSSARVWPATTANTAAWGSVAVKSPYAQADRLSSGGDQAYFSSSGLYVPYHLYHVQSSTLASSGDYTASVTTKKITGTEGSYSVANNSTAYRTGSKVNNYNNKILNMKTIDELSAYGVTWDADAKAYLYNTAGGTTTFQYTDHVGISFSTPNTKDVYFEVAPEDVADLPFPDQVIDVNGTKYARAYNEYLITNIEYYDAANGAVNFVDGDTTTTKVGAVGAAVEFPADPTKDGYEFDGWFDGDTEVTSATFAAGAPKTYTAKWTEVIPDTSVVVDDITLQGKNMQIKAVNNVKGYEVKSSTTGALSVNNDALVLKYNSQYNIGDTFMGSTAPASVGALKHTDPNSSAGNAYNDYTLLDESGNPLVAESNTEYVVNISYKQTGRGRIALRFGAGRNVDQIATTNKNHSTIGQDASATSTIDGNSRGNYYIYFGTNFKSQVNGSSETLNHVDEEVQTYAFTFKTGDLSSKVPEFNLVTRYYGDLLEGVSTTPNGEDKYEYKIADIPTVEIYSIQIVKVASGEKPVSYNEYNKGYGYTSVVKVGTPGEAIENVPVNFEGKWYVDTTSTKASKVFDNKYASAYKAVYGYGSVHKAKGFEGRMYLGVKGFSMANVDGVEMLKYRPLTYAECFADIGYGLLNETEMPNEEAQLAGMKKAYSEGAYNMYRVPVEPLTSGNTYKVSVTYKASGEADLHFLFGAEESAPEGVNYMPETIKITDTNGEFVTKSMFLTADFVSKVTENSQGLDDTFTTASNYLFIHLYNEVADVNFTGRPEIYFSDIDVKDLGTVVGVEGASCLTDDAAAEANQQAMRVYFSYETDDGNNIKIDGETYELVERGFIYNNGAINKYTTVGGTEEARTYTYNAKVLKGTGVFNSKITTGFNTGWAYEDGRLWFSNYIRNFNDSMVNNKLLVRGYITFRDDAGNEYTVYSGTINRSVAGIKTAGDASIENF